MTSPRRFLPPWTAEVTPNCFIVRDANGQALSYLYYESETGRRSAAKLLNRDEAPRIAANIAKLPELLQGRLFTEYSQVNRRSFFACMRGLILAMTIRIVLIFAAAVMIAPSLAYGLPTCMTISEARAKFPNETLYSHQHCWNVSAAHGFRALDFRALVFHAFGFRTVAAAPERSPRGPLAAGVVHSPRPALAAAPEPSPPGALAAAPESSPGSKIVSGSYAGAQCQYPPCE